MNVLKPKEIEVFSEAISAFFENMTREKAVVRSAYLLESARAIAWGDYNGVISINGSHVGSVCLSCSREMLTHVLLVLGERDYSEESHCDLVGEIANMMSGRARRYFGERLQISVPRAFSGRTEPIRQIVKSRPYAIPFIWRGYESCLVVNMDRSA